MIRKTSIHGAYLALFLSSFLVSEQKAYASLVQSGSSVSTTMVCVVVLGMAGAAWSCVSTYLNNQKIGAVETQQTQLSSSVGKVSTEVQGISTTQQQHTACLANIQQDIGVMGGDISVLKTTTDKGFEKLQEGQSAIQAKVEHESVAIQQKMTAMESALMREVADIKQRLESIDKMLKKAQESTSSSVPPKQVDNPRYLSIYDSSKTSA